MFDSRSLAFNSVGGKVYGIPISKEISYIYYNKDLFKKAGLTPPAVAYATWDDFFAACDQLKKAGITPLGMDSGDLGWLSNLWFSALIATSDKTGEQWMNTMHPADYNIPEVVSAAGTLQKMLANYTTPDAIGSKYDPMASHFFNGEIAMIPNGPWMIPDFKNTDKAPAGFYDKVGVMLMPMYGMEMVPTPGEMVGTKDPEKVKAAVAFLKYMTSSENQIKALEMAGLQPVSSNVTIPSSLEQSDPLMAQVLALQTKAKVTYGQNQAYWYQNVLDAFSTYIPELAYSHITPAQFCKELGDAAAKN
jgi:raffinose/stachyose/melibiose transport system substrate-binding protein